MNKVVFNKVSLFTFILVFLAGIVVVIIYYLSFFVWCDPNRFVNGSNVEDNFFAKEQLLLLKALGELEVEESTNQVVSRLDSIWTAENVVSFFFYDFFPRVIPSEERSEVAILRYLNLLDEIIEKDLVYPLGYFFEKSLDNAELRLFVYPGYWHLTELLFKLRVFVTDFFYEINYKLTLEKNFGKLFLSPTEKKIFFTNFFYDPLDFSKQNISKTIDSKRNDNFYFMNISSYRAPIFEGNVWYALGKCLNLWSNVEKSDFLVEELMKHALRKPFSVLKKINDSAGILGYSGTPPTNLTFLEDNFKNKSFIDQILSRGLLRRTFNIVSQDPYFRFPERAARLNRFEFSLNQFPNNYENLNSNKDNFFSNVKITGVDKFYSDLKRVVISYSNSIIRDYFFDLENYYKRYNYVFTQYIQQKYGVNNLVYCVTPIQIKHLLSLRYEEIQYILHLMEDVEYFKGRTFIDVHWELYGGGFSLFEDSKKFTLNTLQKKNNESFLFKGLMNFFMSIGFTFLCDFFELFFDGNMKMGFYNPFQIVFPGSYPCFMSEKKYFFKESDLCILPVHLLCKLNDHVIFNQIYSTNIYEQSRSNNFWNLLSNCGITYAERLFKYFEYGKYSPTSIAFFSNGAGHMKTPYEKNFFLVHNPWWESLSFETKEKLVLLSQLDREDLNSLFLDLICRFFENQPFLSIEEIQQLLDSKKSKKNFSIPLSIADLSLLLFERKDLNNFSFVFNVDGFNYQAVYLDGSIYIKNKLSGVYHLYYPNSANLKLDKFFFFFLDLINNNFYLNSLMKTFFEGFSDGFFAIDIVVNFFFFMVYLIPFCDHSLVYDLFIEFIEKNQSFGSDFFLSCFFSKYSDGEMVSSVSNISSIDKDEGDYVCFIGLGFLSSVFFKNLWNFFCLYTQFQLGYPITLWEDFNVEFDGDEFSFFDWEQRQRQAFSRWRGIMEIRESQGQGQGSGFLRNFYRRFCRFLCRASNRGGDFWIVTKIKQTLYDFGIMRRPLPSSYHKDPWYSFSDFFFNRPSPALWQPLAGQDVYFTSRFLETSTIDMKNFPFWKHHKAPVVLPNNLEFCFRTDRAFAYLQYNIFNMPDSIPNKRSLCEARSVPSSADDLRFVRLWKIYTSVVNFEEFFLKFPGFRVFHTNNVHFVPWLNYVFGYAPTSESFERYDISLRRVPFIQGPEILVNGSITKDITGLQLYYDKSFNEASKVFDKQILCSEKKVDRFSFCMHEDVINEKLFEYRQKHNMFPARQQATYDFFKGAMGRVIRNFYFYDLFNSKFPLVKDLKYRLLRGPFCISYNPAFTLADAIEHGLCVNPYEIKFRDDHVIRKMVPSRLDFRRNYSLSLIKTWYGSLRSNSFYKINYKLTDLNLSYYFFDPSFWKKRFSIVSRENFERFCAVQNIIDFYTSRSDSPFPRRCGVPFDCPFPRGYTHYRLFSEHSPRFFGSLVDKLTYYEGSLLYSRCFLVPINNCFNYDNATFEIFKITEEDCVKLGETGMPRFFEILWEHQKKFLSQDSPRWVVGSVDTDYLLRNKLCVDFECKERDSIVLLQRIPFIYEVPSRYFYDIVALINNFSFNDIGMNQRSVHAYEFDQSGVRGIGAVFSGFDAKTYDPSKRGYFFYPYRIVVVPWYCEDWSSSSVPYIIEQNRNLYGWGNLALWPDSLNVRFGTCTKAYEEIAKLLCGCDEGNPYCDPNNRLNENARERFRSKLSSVLAAKFPPVQEEVRELIRDSSSKIFLFV